MNLALYPTMLPSTTCWILQIHMEDITDFPSGLDTASQTSFFLNWYSPSFLLGYLFIAGRFCINDVTKKCHRTTLCLRPRHTILHFGLFLELLSLVLRNKSHPSFLVGDCTRSFLQVKCICMVRNIKAYSQWKICMHKYMIMQLFQPIQYSSISHGKFLDALMGPLID